MSNIDISSNDELLHYGVARRSGRYPWGSGEDPYQRSGDFLSRCEELKKSGLSETEIAKSMGLKTTQYRTQKSLAKAERRKLEVATAKGLREKGYSLNEIAEKMGYSNDSSIRSLLNEGSEARMNQAKSTADFLRDRVKEKGIIDVGAGSEKEIGSSIGNLSKEKMNQALYMLELEGYKVYGLGVPQATNPGKQTTLKLLCPPGTEYPDAYAAVNKGEVYGVRDYYTTYDGGDTYKPAFAPPSSLDSKRLKIRYADEKGPDGATGNDKDGVIEIRRGVEDISLGNSHYAQVRIMVDGTHYLKGMAVYSDDMPDGVDVIFNTNKSSNTPALGPKNNTVLKIAKDDQDNPFGALLKEHGGQRYYIDKDGKEKLSPINKTREEGDWDEWDNKLSSQFLSKQPMQLIRKQLNMAAEDKQMEFDEICSYNNPTVKKQLLQSFADDCDSAAVHLKAAALPRQRYQVILPISSLKDNEVYAPNYKDGEQVALIRYPHGGTFEIPILTVRNKNAEGKRVIGTDALDAVGINKKVADRLSGADFDGDTVMVIPTGGSVKIKSTNPLEGLKDFDAKFEYGGKPEGTYQKMRNTQTEMGKISNLITDMTLKGAGPDELARAVRHSMVVIDAEKHGLDYKQSERDHGIAQLKKDYQGTYDKNGKYHEGASTLISRAKSETSVLKRVGSPKIDKETGKVTYKEVYEEYVDKKTGKTKVRMQPSTKMAETDDAYTLVSDANTPQERAYADYANKMKSLANQARKEMVNTGRISYSASAKETYKNEVNELEARLNVALKNAPRERQAQVIAKSVVEAKKQANPDMSKSEIKKEGQRALIAARTRVGASGKNTKIQFTDRQWEAIQAGAISENKLSQILSFADMDSVRERATPRSKTTLSQTKINKVKSMQASGYTTAQIADAVGCSTSTVSKYLSGKE